MQHEQTDYRIWKYVKDSEGIGWAEANRQMELGWLEYEQSQQLDEDVVDDPDTLVHNDAMDSWEAGFMAGEEAAA